jgi:hypothetical protein
MWAVFMASLLALAVPASAGYPNGSPGGNLSGYAQTGTTYTSVAAKWRVPSVTFGTSTSFNSNLQWIGINGLSGDDRGGMIQGGTGQDIVAVTGVVGYYGWYANADGGVQKLSSVSFPVRPDDVMSGSVTCVENCTPNSNAVWNFVLQDLTQDWTFSQKLTIRGTMHSADIIEEVTSNGSGGSYTWPNFGTVAFTDVMINDGAPIFSTVDELYSSNATATSNPSDPNDTADGFNVCWGTRANYTPCPATTNSAIPQ